MQRRLRILWIALLLNVSVAVFAQVRPLPDGWFKAGSRPGDYDTGVEATSGRAGAAAFLKARPEATIGQDFGTIMQSFVGEAYRGKRLRLSAQIKATGVTGWAGLWMRVDGPPQGPPLAFDNMQGRPIKGSHDWTQHAIVLDVPAGTSAIAFGVLLSGPGQVWIDDVRFETVGMDVPSTNILQPQPLPALPRSLTFE
jgi:hypothetical protein